MARQWGAVLPLHHALLRCAPFDAVRALVAADQDAVREELDRKIAQCQRDGRIFQAYKYLFYLTRIADGGYPDGTHPHLPGIWRIFAVLHGQLLFLFSSFLSALHFFMF